MLLYRMGRTKSELFTRRINLLFYLYFPPTSTPTRPLENVVTTKGLQDRNIHILDGTTGENKGKTINEF